MGKIVGLGCRQKKDEELTAKVAELEATISQITNEKETVEAENAELTAKVAELEATIAKKGNKKEE